MQLRAASSLVAAAALLVGAGGCGDSGMDLNELQAKANAICKRAEKDLHGIPAPRDNAAAKATAEHTLRVTQRAIDDLAKLDPPPEIRDRYNLYLKNLRQQQKFGRELVGRIEVGDAQGASTLLGANAKLRRDNDAIVKAIELPDCAS